MKDVAVGLALLVGGSLLMVFISYVWPVLVLISLYQLFREWRRRRSDAVS